MRAWIILIILGFTQIVICLNLSNVTYDDSYPVCPINFFRRKRAHTEYTRWKANLETTQEFIVKVLDDELTTPNTKQIVAINIQPVTKGGEKIIVGGVIVPSVTTMLSTLDASRDYTRFVPPTTVPVSQVDEELYLAPAIPPKSIDVIVPIKPKGRHSLRDESPPASPQFLARTPALLARQYAPIAPVAFTRRSTMSPLKPLTSTLYKSEESVTISEKPTRTSALPDISRPSRTDAIPDERLYDYIKEITPLGFKDFLTRSTHQLPLSPIRTSLLITDPSIEDDNEDIINNGQSTAIQIPLQDTKVYKDNDDLYNMMFYNDEDSERSSKTSERIENYNEKNNLSDDIDRTSGKLQSTLTEVINFSETMTTYADEDELNITETSPYVQTFNPIVPQPVTIISSKEKTRGKRRPVCNLLKLRQLNFNSPRTLPEIVSQLKQWAENSPVAKWEDITHGNLTTMENPIYMMIVDDPSSGQIISAKQTVMLIAGIQGRDHHAVAAAMYVLYQLIERSEAHSDLLSKYRFWIIPVFNPDGYDYSMTFPQHREWSKNLRQNWDFCKSRDSCESCSMYGLRCTVQQCYGVNLDRNFEYQWIPPEELQTEHPCGSLHAGARQLSEAETWALTHFLHEKRMPLYTFIAFKEGEVLGVMYPYSHTRKLRAFDHVYRQRASRAASAAFVISGRPYVAGQTSEFLPLYAGGVEDWVDGHLGIDNTYTIMMFRPTDSYNTKLITERVVHEAYAAMDTLLLQSIEPLGPPPVSLKRVNSVSATRSNGPVISIIVFVAVQFR